jgi:hypothetical protein
MASEKHLPELVGRRATFLFLWGVSHPVFLIGVSGRTKDERTFFQGYTCLRIHAPMSWLLSQSVVLRKVSEGAELSDAPNGVSVLASMMWHLNHEEARSFAGQDPSLLSVIDSYWPD